MEKNILEKKTFRKLSKKRFGDILKLIEFTIKGYSGWETIWNNKGKDTHVRVGNGGLEFEIGNSGDKIGVCVIGWNDLYAEYNKRSDGFRVLTLYIPKKVKKDQHTFINLYSWKDKI